MNILIKRLLSQEHSWQKPYGTKEPTKRINVDRQKRSYLYRFTVHITNIQQKSTNNSNWNKENLNLFKHTMSIAQNSTESRWRAHKCTHVCIAWIAKKKMSDWKERRNDRKSLKTIYRSFCCMCCNFLILCA